MQPNQRGWIVAETTVTLTLPSSVFDGLRQRAHAHQRRVEDEASLVLAASLAGGDSLPADFAQSLETLKRLGDAALWRVSHSRPSVEDAALMDALVDQRARLGLNADEEQLLAELVDRFDRVMVLRAEAVALLHARGVDIQERVARA
jgi:plasmid stability protein